MKISYAYDAAGNRTKKTAGGVETTYVYDPANRLTSETSGGNTITYGYDPRGNLTSKTEGSDVTAYGWDARNRLTQVTFPDASSESYEYDAQDRRVTKVNAGGTTRYVWDKRNLLQERDGSGVVQAHYTDTPGEWGGLTSQRRGATSSFYGFDLQGSTRFLSDASGNVTDSYEYSAYGEELSQSGSTANTFRYNGQWGYYRDNTQRLYVRARHYQPSQGRWISRDPIGFRGGDWNLYRYVGNNPPNAVDPSGQVIVIGVALLLGAAAAGAAVVYIWYTTPAGQKQAEDMIAGGAKVCEWLYDRSQFKPGNRPPRPPLPPIPGRRESCEEEYPDYVHPDKLWAYPFSGSDCSSARRPALEEMKSELEIYNLNFGSHNATEKGPCIGIGTHTNVYSGGSSKGAIVCCPTCIDTLSGPKTGCQCGIIPKY